MLFPGGGCLRIVDPLCTGATQCDGARYLRPDPSAGALPVSDLNVLAEADVERVGAVADGVTTLLLRVQSSEDVELSLLDPNGMPASPEFGLLARRDGSAPGNVVVVPSEATARGAIAFGLYRTPAVFPPSVTAVSQGAPVALWARGLTTGTVRTTALTLAQPAIVLVHGVWSDWRAWGFFEDHARNLGFDICPMCRVDYGSAQPAASFDPLTRIRSDQYAVRNLITSVELALREKRRAGIAAAQVDVVGHSMGGLIARSRVRFPFAPYRTPASYNRGAFHKIVTFGTPHHGSPLADWLVEHRCDQLQIVDELGARLTLEGAFGLVNRPLRAAIFEMQTGSSALGNLGPTDVPVHAMTGVEPLAGSDTELYLDLIPPLAGHAATSVDGLLGGDGAHDTVVPVSSQTGGWPGATTEIDGVVHANMSVDNFDYGETEYPPAWSAILGLLRAPIEEPTFAPVAAYTPSGPSLPAAPCPALFAPAAPVTRTLTITPPAGTVLDPNNLFFPIGVSLQGGNPIDGVLLRVGDRTQGLDAPGPFELSYNAARDTAGIIPITAQTYGPGPENYYASSWLVVQASGPPTSIQVVPSVLELHEVGERFQLRVLGAYAGGGRLDLTQASAGTSYAPTSGAATVITVTPGGLVEATGPGQDVVLVSNRGRSASMRVKVTAANRPPSLLPPSSVSLAAGDLLDVPLLATDPDGDAIVVSAPGSPPWASLEELAGGAAVLHLAPGPGDEGAHDVVITASDDDTPVMGDAAMLHADVDACGTPAPAGVPDLTADVEGFSWPPLPGATAYDVAPGDLSLLRTGGDFASATLACMARSLRATSIALPAAPAAGEGAWILVRARSCGGLGTYDSSAASQVGTRDAGIEAAGRACPRIGCGNGYLESGEVCDGADLGGLTCQSEGFSGGTLACAPTCGALDTTGCL